MDRTILLQEVNQLVSSGMRKAAIDLLNEHLIDHPNDPFILRALGRIYLLEKKPAEAVKYLRLSLGFNDKKPTQDHVSVYEFDGLDHDDLNYIESISTKAGLDYFYENEEIDQIIVSSLEPFEENHEKPILESPSDIDEKESDDFEWHPLKEKSKNIYPRSDTEDDSGCYLLDTFDECIQEELTELTDFEDEDEEGFDEVFVSEDEPSIEDEFDWDSIEDFDDVDVSNNYTFGQDGHVAIEGKVSRAERAKQIATEVILSYDWDIHNLSLLQQVFYENGWAAARVAIEYELGRGLMPEELELAIFVRRLWTENQQYWISFIHVRSKLSGQATRAAYKNMSWREALRIIRAFGKIPAEEEIQLLIEELYDDWYTSPYLQKQYKAFIRFLKYRTGSVRHTLPANELFSFIPAYEQETWSDLPRDDIKIGQNVEELKKQGIDLENMLQNIEQRYRVNKFYEFEDDDYAIDLPQLSGKKKIKAEKMVEDDNTNFDDADE